MKHYSFHSIRSFVVAVVIVSVLGVPILSNRVVSAMTGDWFLPGAAVEEKKGVPADSSLYSNQAERCIHQQIYVDGKIGVSDACVFRAKSFRLAYLNYFGESVAISVGSDSKFYRLHNVQARFADVYYRVSQGSDRVIYADNWMIRFYDNMATHLTPVAIPGGKEYMLSSDAEIYPRLNTSIMDSARVKSPTLSANGSWAVGEIKGYGLFRLDMASGELLLFTKKVAWYGYGLDPTYQLSITDDGQTIVAGGLNVNPKIYKIEKGCGQSASALTVDWEEVRQRSSFEECPSKGLRDIINDGSASSPISDAVRYFDRPTFNEAGDILRTTAYLYESDDYDMWRWITIKVPGFREDEQIDYLALGDSYSSGEGDVEKKPDGSTYYLAGTEEKGGCHISSRSYPFLLRNYYNIPKDRMRSVACSGAQVVLDYLSRMEGYEGQHGELERNEENVKGSKRMAALESFAPGIVPQLEFVKKYRPKVVTLTGGGNDIGFADIIAYCAGPILQDIYGYTKSDCGYAEPGSLLDGLLNDTINTQYQYNKESIEKIKEYSPDTRVIIIGYPSFIDSDLPVCTLTFNTGALSEKERKAINNGVSRMNSMLKQLAHDTNVSYVDIEDSLYGGRLCEGSEFITGVRDVGYGRVIFEHDVQELFHPNYTGHRKIAEKIYQSGALLADRIPEGTNFSYGQEEPKSFSAKFAEGINFVAGATIRIVLSPLTFLPVTPVHLIGFSEETDLGSYTTDTNGGLDISVDTSALPVGRHVIVLEGKTYSGESVRYYQFINIVSASLEGPSFEDFSIGGEAGRPMLSQQAEDGLSDEVVSIEDKEASKEVSIAESKAPEAVSGVKGVGSSGGVALASATSRRIAPLALLVLLSLAGVAIYATKKRKN